MKKILFTLIVSCAFIFAANAQTSATPAAPQISKEEKAKIKAKQEEDLAASFKQAGLTDEQTAKAREVLADAATKNNDLKKNTTFTDTEKETEKKKINDEKNSKLKEIMGTKYKAWTNIRKEQKTKMVDGNTNTKSEPQ